MNGRTRSGRACPPLARARPRFRCEELRREENRDASLDPFAAGDFGHGRSSRPLGGRRPWRRSRRILISPPGHPPTPRWPPSGTCITTTPRSPSSWRPWQRPIRSGRGSRVRGVPTRIARCGSSPSPALTRGATARSRPSSSPARSTPTRSRGPRSPCTRPGICWRCTAAARSSPGWSTSGRSTSCR